MKLKSDALSQLVHSLNKEEKRHFTRFAKTMGSETSNYMKLFDWISEQPEYDENLLKNKWLRLGAKQKFADGKQYLYDLVLDSLQHLYRKSTIDEELMAGFRAARILHRKGLLEQLEVHLHKLRDMCYQYDKIFFIPLVEDWIDTIDHRIKGVIMSDEALEKIYEERLASVENIKTHFKYSFAHHLSVIRTRKSTLLERQNESAPINLQTLFDNTTEAEVEAMSLSIKMCFLLGKLHYHHFRLEYEANLHTCLQMLRILDDNAHMLKDRIFFLIRISCLLNGLSSMMRLRKFHLFRSFLDDLQQLPSEVGLPSGSKIHAYYLQVDYFTKTGAFDLAKKPALLLEAFWK